jgi:hypothetical protein
MNINQDVSSRLILIGSIFFIVIGSIITILSNAEIIKIIGSVIVMMGGGLLFRGVAKFFLFEEAKVTKKGITKFLTIVGALPRFTETSLFLITVTVLLLVFLGGSSFHQDIYYHWLKDGHPGLIAMLGMIVAGMMLSIYYVISIKPISKTGKDFLLFFVLFANFFAAYVAADYAFKYSIGIFVIFPILNIITTFLLFFTFRLDFIDISDRQARKSELILGLIMIACLFFISQFILHNYWVITFSLCVVYATNVNEVIYNAFKNN